jgi:thymidylate synthase (FAD)
MAYKQAEKKAIENARYVLPNACETKIMVTMNARSLLNFFTERCCIRAQEEIRDMANQMLILCKEVAPIVFKNAGPSCKRGKCKEGKMSCKKGG